jgi:N-acetylneuraminic acid mutarotase
MPVGLVSAGHTKFGTDMYIAGGKTGADPGDRVATFQRYDMQNDVWEALADVPGTPREDIALVEHDGLIYAFGGATTTFNLGDSQVAAAYDPIADTWDDTGVLDLAAGLTSAQAVSWKGEIWIIGGFNSIGESLNQVLIYDPALDSYDPGPALPAPRDNTGVAIQDGGTAVDELYVIGGRNAQGSSPLTKVNSWVLNETDNGWDDIAALPVARRSFVVATVDTKIQVFGGENDGGTAGLGQVDEYDPATNTWTTLTGFDWPNPRHGAAGAQAEVEGETIVFMAGGATLAGAASTTAANDSFNRALATP